MKGIIMHLSRRTVSVLTILIAVVLLFLFSVFIFSQRPIEQAREETTNLINIDHPIEETTEFYLLTTPEETYFSLEFTTTDNEPMYGIVARDSGETVYYNYNELITNEDALAITVNDLNPTEVQQARLGLVEDEPVWEVTYIDEDSTMGYYYISAKDGSWIQTISNL